MSGGLPAISGPDLIKLLLKNGWQEEGRVTHGMALSKIDSTGRRIPVVIPTKSRSLPKGTLNAILRETKLGRDGLLELLSGK